ncbi:hypothetical protein [Halobacterium zhouii]|uniref:hypothetical protein n=1 Tax=Halobacterium zhouii TaxID=2902624 RepID=UPI001E2D9678|nr:hypothetical protein [Halobacterium zhouii]
MHRRRLLVATWCALLVVCAGCSGFPGGSSSPTTPATTGESPTTVAPTATADGPTANATEQLAPGLTANGVTDALALANAHRDVLTSNPFVQHTSLERTNGTERSFRRSTLRYANQSHWLWNVSASGVPLALGVTSGAFVSYADGQKVVYRLEANGEVVYNVRRISGRADAPPVPPKRVLPESVYGRDFLYTLFANADVTVEDTQGPAYRLTGTAEELVIDQQTATNVEFTANVSEAGLVRSLRLTYEQGNATVERTLSVELTDGDPAERPDWYDRAVNQTSGG